MFDVNHLKGLYIVDHGDGVLAEREKYVIAFRKLSSAIIFCDKIPWDDVNIDPYYQIKKADEVNFSYTFRSTIKGVIIGDGAEIERIGDDEIDIIWEGEPIIYAN